MTDPAVIETKNLCKSFGRKDAVRDLTLRIAPRRITGFIGRNGAGKSTTIKMLLGMLRPSAGSGTVLGGRIDDPDASVDLRRRVAYVSEDKRLYPYMTVAEIIHFTAAFYPDWRSDVADILIRKYELPPEGKVKSLSKGMRSKLALLLAISRRPALLILDEPSEGLDPIGVEQLLESLVSQCGEGAAVFFSSHQIEEVERIADHVCIIEQGQLVADVSLDEIRRQYRRIDLVFPADPPEREFQLAGVESVRTSGRQMRVFSTGNTEAIVELARALHATAIDIAPIGLRDVYLSLVKERTHAVA